ncbi:MAG: BamA/TamA family outer membrane protein [Campylobacterota bacterium]|nr:BamA/TamA family outer membrane protein [Campylobacterota bacterium]
MKNIPYLTLCLFSTFLHPTLLFSDDILHYQTLEDLPTYDANITQSKEWIILPFAFSSESTGTAGGVGVIKQGLLQPQTTLVTSIFGGLPEEIVADVQHKESSFFGGFLYFSDYKLPFSNRLFFTIIGLKSYFPNTQYYFNGTNDSKQKDVFKTSGDANFINTTFRYVLPIGEGIDNPNGLFMLNNGFCVGRDDCGGKTPFTTGRTAIGIKTFYQSDTFETNTLPQFDSWDTNGLRFFLEHDNTDFNLNPSRGYHFDLQYSRDFGKGDSLQSWDFLEFKYNHYINLDTFSFTKQNVLALSMWTGYSFSWDNNKEIVPGINAHRPPTWEGGRLGGFFKMRGYDNNRFSDKAVFYATAEYRAILDYNPFNKNETIPVAIDWFQVVAFVEAGRVHDQYNINLLSDMKYDVGISLRAFVAQLPIRFDVAYGEEGANMWIMINQPFDF